MLEPTFPIQNFYWYRGAFQPPLDGDGGTHGVSGQFALAWARGDGRVILTRDRLGVNKLFFAVHESGKVVAGNYLIDLVRNGVPIEAIYSVPAGHAVAIDLDRLHLTRSAAGAVAPAPEPIAAVDGIAWEIRATLEGWFARLAAQFSARPIWVCLSGGLDSGLIAALARKYFRDVTAYTYTFAAPGTRASEDAVAAERLAAALAIPLRLVPATADDVREVLADAICYAQDWRDFNVHCAVVNELLGRAMHGDAARLSAGAAPLVLTGDLANELIADYTPVAYNGAEYYPLPRLEASRLRLALIRGLDAGDREVGVFNHHGLDVIQPYGFVVDHYLRLPGSFIGETGAKQHLGRLIAGDLLPPFVFDRGKVRAQLGSATDAPGILGVLASDGCDGAWLRAAFCRTFIVRDARFLDTFIRAGRYRSVPDDRAGRRSWIDGYLAG